MPEIPRAMLAELDAALTVLRRSGGRCAVILRLSRDRAGVERLEAETFEGINLHALAVADVESAKGDRT